MDGHAPLPTARPYGTASPRGYALTRAFLAAVMPLFGRLRIEGLENIPTHGPVIIAINHVHWSDIPYISLRVRRITHYMAKIELFGVPGLGFIMRSLGSFPVRRGEGDRQALKLAEQLLAEGEALVIFPEGHRSSAGSLGSGHPGIALIALHSQAPIVPAAISGTQRVLRLGLRYGPFAPRVLVRFGTPYVLPREGKRVTRDELMRSTATIMSSIAALLPVEMRGAHLVRGETHAQQVQSALPAPPSVAGASDE